MKLKVEDKFRERHEIQIKPVKGDPKKRFTYPDRLCPWDGRGGRTERTGDSYFVSWLSLATKHGINNYEKELRLIESLGVSTYSVMCDPGMAQQLISWVCGELHVDTPLLCSDPGRGKILGQYLYDTNNAKDSSIVLFGNGWNVGTLLHELSHHLDRLSSGDTSHGLTFFWWLERVTRWWMRGYWVPAVCEDLWCGND